jgi:hypothetical protein
MKVLQFASDAHRETPVDLFVIEPFDFNEERIRRRHRLEPNDMAGEPAGGVARLDETHAHGKVGGGRGNGGFCASHHRIASQTRIALHRPLYSRACPRTRRRGAAIISKPSAKMSELNFRKYFVAPLSSQEKALVDELVADGLEIQHRFRPKPLYKETGTGHYGGSTVEDLQKARRPAKSKAEAFRAAEQRRALGQSALVAATSGVRAASGGEQIEHLTRQEKAELVFRMFRSTAPHTAPATSIGPRGGLDNAESRH